MEKLFLKRFEELLFEHFEGNKAQLAKSTGISASTLSQYYPPRSSAPSAKQLILLAKAFNCSIDYLLGLEDELGVIHTTGPALSSLEEELLSIFRKLNIFERESIIIQMRALAENKASTPLKKK